MLILNVYLMKVSLNVHHEVQALPPDLCSGFFHLLSFIMAPGMALLLRHSSSYPPLSPSVSHKAVALNIGFETL